jgi:hypothetical protein
LFGAGGSRGQKDGGCGSDEFLAVVFADAKDIEADLVGELDFFE